ncbi:MAG: DnaJ domain-containing protein [Pseudomonadota bacterium]
MENRRNFYRILRVQPDATADVIRHSYRSLMQKLKLHPDLGGENRDAGLVNQAYNTLRDRKRRAAYDAELLSLYNIKTLAGADRFFSDRNPKTTDAGNQRNYYRLLHVQPDAEVEVIRASYKALVKLAGSAMQALLDEAMAVLTDPNQRSRYDKLIREYSHAESVQRLRTEERLRRSSKTVVAKEPELDSERYDAPISYYCLFCKTPCAAGDRTDPHSVCIECQSPLALPAEGFADSPRRSVARMAQDEGAHFYVDWPGAAHPIALTDLSPVGVSFSTGSNLEVDQIIKLDARHFKAVAQVAHTRPQGPESNVGARFAAISFARESGTFLSVST